MITPRPYQQEALDALDSHICERKGNPCVVIPTGGGKSALIAWAIQRWTEEYPHFRCCVLQHRKELIEQNASELAALYPGADIGIYSASIGRRDYDSAILFASIDSIFKRAGEFVPFDVLMIDEAHRIPFSGEGKYRTFIEECRKFNPNLVVIGWTATPFRMNGGELCHKDHILNSICYEAKVHDLIKDGYLSLLRSKVGIAQPDLKGIFKSRGDYVLKSLARVTGNVVEMAVAEAVRIIGAEDRKATIFFCVDVEHCKRVSAELMKHGIFAPFVTGTTPAVARTRVVEDFKAGRLRAICNVNVYTEGFNAQHVDCIVLLRPTLSKGLYSQMVGRGLRIHQGKADCLILDFAGCIDEHGPIDLLGGKPIVLALCKQCREFFSRALKVCPACGWVIPKIEMQILDDREKRERRMHGEKASRQSILSGEPQTYRVDCVFVNRHIKEDSPDSLRVQYRCGKSMYQEWVCLDHDGYAGKKAQAWWRKRFGQKTRTDNMTVNGAMEDMFVSQTIAEWTKTITVVKNKKFWEIVNYNQPVENER